MSFFLENLFSKFWGRIEEEAEPKPEDMIRNTWGTACSDKSKPFSFTFYAFSEFELDGVEQDRCEDKFITLIDRWIRRQHPNRSWNYRDGEADGWFVEIVRTESNVPTEYDPDYFMMYSFEVNQNEVEVGSLESIL